MKMMSLNDRNRVPCENCGTSFTKYTGDDGKAYCNGCIVHADMQYICTDKNCANVRHNHK